MSCYVVSQADIALLTEALYRYEVLTHPLAPDDVGQMLWHINHCSVNYRYQESEPTPAYTHVTPDRALVRNAALVYKQTQHYIYQSCEHPTWEGSFAWDMMDALEKATLGALAMNETQIRNTPAWDTLPWGLEH